MFCIFSQTAYTGSQPCFSSLSFYCTHSILIVARYGLLKISTTLLMPLNASRTLNACMLYHGTGARGLLHSVFFTNNYHKAVYDTDTYYSTY